MMTINKMCIRDSSRLVKADAQATEHCARLTKDFTADATSAKLETLFAELLGRGPSHHRRPPSVLEAIGAVSTPSDEVENSGDETSVWTTA